MIVIQDALPLALAKEINGRFESGNYAQQAQHNHEYYGNGEMYLCRFKRTQKLEAEDEVFKKVLLELCKVMVKAGLEVGNAEAFAYKMSEGDFFREHDDLTNGTGFVYYLSRNWKWDWGGILIVEENGNHIAVTPKFNQLVVIPKGARHFVTPVMGYAREPRYTMVGFIK